MAWCNAFKPAPPTPLEEEVSSSQVDQSTQSPAASASTPGTKRKAAGVPDCETTDGNTDNREFIKDHMT